MNTSMSQQSFEAHAPDDLSLVNVGSSWRSAPRTLTADELELACKLSGDWHPIHADAAYAAATPLGQRIFHGGYGVLLALGEATHFPEVGTRQAIALGMDAWNFKAPLFIGDTVHVQVEITEMRTASDGQRVVLKKRVQLLKSSGELVQEGSTASLVHLSTAHGDRLGATT